MGETDVHKFLKNWTALGLKLIREPNVKTEFRCKDGIVDVCSDNFDIEIIKSHVPDRLKDLFFITVGNEHHSSTKIIKETVIKDFENLKDDEKVMTSLYTRKTENIKAWAKSLEESGQKPNTIARTIVNDLIRMGCRRGVNWAYEVLDKKYKRDYKQMSDFRHL